MTVGKARISTYLQCRLAVFSNRLPWNYSMSSFADAMRRGTWSCARAMTGCHRHVSPALEPSPPRLGANAFVPADHRRRVSSLLFIYVIGEVQQASVFFIDNLLEPFHAIDADCDQGISSRIVVRSADIVGWLGTRHNRRVAERKTARREIWDDPRFFSNEMSPERPGLKTLFEGVSSTSTWHRDAVTSEHIFPDTARRRSASYGHVRGVKSPVPITANLAFTFGIFDSGI